MKNMKPNNKSGITLIALVVTIIVLLILSGISIMMLTGQNGILTQAQNAKENTNGGTQREAIEYAYEAAMMNKYIGDSTDFNEIIENELKNSGYSAKVTKTKSGYKVKIDENSYIIDFNGNVTDYDENNQLKCTIEGRDSYGDGYMFEKEITFEEGTTWIEWANDEDCEDIDLTCMLYEGDNISDLTFKTLIKKSYYEKNHNGQIYLTVRGGLGYSYSDEINFYEEDGEEWEIVDAVDEIERDKIYILEKDYS